MFHSLCFVQRRSQGVGKVQANVLSEPFWAQTSHKRLQCEHLLLGIRKGGISSPGVEPQVSGEGPEALSFLPEAVGQLLPCVVGEHPLSETALQSVSDRWRAGPALSPSTLAAPSLPRRVRLARRFPRSTSH